MRVSQYVLPTGHPALGASAAMALALRRLPKTALGLCLLIGTAVIALQAPSVNATEGLTGPIITPVEGCQIVDTSADPQVVSTPCPALEDTGGAFAADTPEAINAYRAVAGGLGMGDPVAVDDAETRRRVANIPGEQIDMRTGALSLSMVDLRVPGNGGMAVTVGRTRRSSFFEPLVLGGGNSGFPLDGGDYAVERSFGDTAADWALDIPHIRMIRTFNRVFDMPGICANPIAINPYAPAPYTALDWRYFKGVQLVGITGEPPRELVWDGNGSYQSTDNWRATCAQSSYFNLPGGTEHPVSKFVVQAPDGRTMEFDEPGAGNNADGLASSNLGMWGYQRVFLTRVTDRNGNWIQYNYHALPATNFRPAQDFPYLHDITTSAGSQVRFQWECGLRGARTFRYPGSPSDPAGLPACEINVDLPTIAQQACATPGAFYYKGSTPTDLTDDKLCGGSPVYRLKNFSFRDRTWRFSYSDDLVGIEKGRYLTGVTVQASNGRGQAIAGRDWRYQISHASPSANVTYTVTHPQGGSVAYLLGSRYFERRTGGSFDIFYFMTALGFKTVDRTGGVPGDVWRMCYLPFVRDNGSARSYLIGPNRMTMARFDKEHINAGDDNKWREGMLLEDAAYRTDARTCEAIVNSPPATLRQTSYDWSVGRTLSTAITPAYPGSPSHDLYDEPTRKTKRMKQSVVSQADAGRFETLYQDFDNYDFPATVVEHKLPASGSTPLLTRVSRTTYDHLTNPRVLGLPRIRSVDGIAGAITNAYSPLGDLLSTNEYGRTRSFTYYSTGDIETATDERNNTTRFDDYKLGTARRVTYPAKDPVIETLAVNDSGTIASVTNARQYTVGYTYDAHDRLATVTYPIGTATGIVWSTPQTKITTRGNRRITQSFDGFGRLLETRTEDVSRGEQSRLTYRYDADGRTTFQSYPLAAGDAEQGYRFDYDEFDRETRKTITADSTFSTTAYSIAPTANREERRAVTDFRGNTVTYEHRSFGGPNYEQLLKVSAPVTNVAADGTPTQSMQTTTFTPDLLGFATTATQGTALRRYHLDSRRLLADEYAPELGAPDANGYNIHYERNARGDIESKSIAGIQLFSATLNAQNRLVSTDYLDRAQNDLGIDYSSTGKTDLLVSGAVQIDPEFDPMDRVTSETYRIDGYQFRLGYEYDGLGNVAALSYPSGKRYEQSPDAFGRPRGVTGIVIAASYYGSGLVHEIHYRNGETTTLTRTIRNYPDTIVTSGVAAAVNLDYGYDSNGNMSSVVNALSPNDSYGAGYDQLDRLISTTFGATVYRRGYDEIGNARFDQGPDQNLSFGYDAATNRLISVAGISNNADIQRNLNYDARGNMSSDGARTLTFDYAGTLLTGQGSASKSFVYDPHKRAIREDLAQPGGGTQRKYSVYAGEHLMFEFWPATKRFVEYVYLGNVLVGSREVENADQFDSDGDGIKDLSEFL